MKFKELIPGILSACIVLTTGLIFLQFFHNGILPGLCLLGFFLLMMGMFFKRGQSRVAFGMLTGLFVLVGGLLTYIIFLLAEQL